MPRPKRSKKGPPEGFDVLESTLEEIDQKMREGTKSVGAKSLPSAII
jgi:hypothetical protein